MAACWAGLFGAAVPGASADSAAAGRPAPAAPTGLPVSAAAVYAPQTGQFLYAVNPDREVAIASTTKLMTALVTLEHVHRLSTVFTQNNWYAAPGDSQLGLAPGDRATVHDLLLAMMLPSADDAAEDLAYNVGGGSVPRFVAMMNAEAHRLGLRHTHFTTPIGLDTAGNYSTAADLATLANYDLTHSAFFRRIVALPSAVVQAGGRSVRITNLNDLVGRYRWIDGVKTGHTLQAGYVLVAAGHRHGMSLISVVLGTPNPLGRDDTSLALLNYGLGDFTLRRPLSANEVLARPGVQDQSGRHVPVVAARGFARILPRADRLALRVRLPRQLTAPLPAQAVVGTVEVVDDGRVLDRIPLVSTRQLTPAGGLDSAIRFVTQPVTLLVVAAVIGGLFWTGTRRRRRVGRQGGEVEAA
jgi:serine-type D-Ala-D-Ala carboxypeptidase (penicillin-binding protein 5/6)